MTDESGQDVTPLPLLSQDAVKAKQSNLLTDGSGGTVSKHTSDFFSGYEIGIDFLVEKKRIKRNQSI